MRSVALVGLLASFALGGCTMESKFAKHASAVHVAIARDGTTSIDGKPVLADDLVARARDQYEAHFVIDAERDVSFQVLLAALERLHAGGANDIALGAILPSAEPPPPPPPPPP